MEILENKKVTKVCFLFIGSFDPETKIIEVESRNIEELDIPNNSYAFYFYDLVVAKFNVDGDEIEAFSNKFNKSPMFLINAEVYSLGKIEHYFGKESSLYRNAQSIKKQVIMCRTGNFQFLQKGDLIIKL